MEIKHIALIILVIISLSVICVAITGTNNENNDQTTNPIMNSDIEKTSLFLLVLL